VSRHDPNGLSKTAATVTPPPMEPNRIRENCASLLVSIATLLSFLSPPELRQLLIKRIDDSQPPYKGAACFLEFMQSGSDSIPKGKTALKIRAAQRSRIAALKRTTKEMSDGSSASTINVSIPQDSDPFIQSTASQSRPDANTVQSHEYDILDTDNELEEGELPCSILPSPTVAKSGLTSSDKHITCSHDSKSPKKIQNISNALSKPTTIADDEPKSTPRKRKRKRKNRASLLHPTVNDAS